MGKAIEYTPEKGYTVPDEPIIPVFPGDGIGPDLWNATQPVLDTAVAKAYGGKKRIEWLEIPVGEVAFKATGKYLPDESLETIKKYRVALKGPLTTPVGKGFRSLNVQLRQSLELYACIRPVNHLPGVPSPVKDPDKVDMIIFRENMEDLYAGIEWESGTPEAAQMIKVVKEMYGKDLPADTAIGIKPISRSGTRRLVRMAIQYAIDHNLPTVTLMHKGNIMKFTEGGFRKWGYEVAADEFADKVVTEEWVTANGGEVPAGKVLLKDRIADAMFQQILLRPAEYDVIATPNLNGDYISDALAAQVGGLGMAPGSNVGDGFAIFEATHGTAPKYAGQDKVNPGSLILSGAMMLDFLGWREAAELVRKAISKTVEKKIVTYDLARQMPGATKVSCSGFGKAICENM